MAQHGDKISTEMLREILLDTLAEAEEETDQIPNYMIAMEERCKVEILSFEQIAEEHIEAKVRVTAPDLYHVIKALQNEAFSTETAMDAALTQGVDICL